MWEARVFLALLGCFIQLAASQQRAVDPYSLPSLIRQPNAWPNTIPQPAIERAPALTRSRTHSYTMTQHRVREVESGAVAHTAQVDTTLVQLGRDAPGQQRTAPVLVPKRSEPSDKANLTSPTTLNVEFVEEKSTREAPKVSRFMPTNTNIEIEHQIFAEAEGPRDRESDEARAAFNARAQAETHSADHEREQARAQFDHRAWTEARQPQVSFSSAGTRAIPGGFETVRTYTHTQPLISRREPESRPYQQPMEFRRPEHMNYRRPEPIEGRQPKPIVYTHFSQPAVQPMQYQLRPPQERVELPKSSNEPFFYPNRFTGNRDPFVDTPALHREPVLNGVKELPIVKESTILSTHTFTMYSDGRVNSQHSSRQSTSLNGVSDSRSQRAPVVEVLGSKEERVLGIPLEVEPRKNVVRAEPMRENKPQFAPKPSSFFYGPVRPMVPIYGFMQQPPMKFQQMLSPPPPPPTQPNRQPPSFFGPSAHFFNTPSLIHPSDVAAAGGAGVSSSDTVSFIVPERPQDKSGLVVLRGTPEPANFVGDFETLPASTLVTVPLLGHMPAQATRDYTIKSPSEDYNIPLRPSATLRRDMPASAAFGPLPGEPVHAPDNVEYETIVEEEAGPIEVSVVPDFETQEPVFIKLIQAAVFADAPSSDMLEYPNAKKLADPGKDMTTTTASVKPMTFREYAESLTANEQRQRGLNVEERAETLTVIKPQTVSDFYKTPNTTINFSDIPADKPLVEMTVFASDPRGAVTDSDAVTNPSAALALDIERGAAQAGTLSTSDGKEMKMGDDEQTVNTPHGPAQQLVPKAQSHSSESSVNCQVASIDHSPCDFSTAENCHSKTWSAEASFLTMGALQQVLATSTVGDDNLEGRARLRLLKKQQTADGWKFDITFQATCCIRQVKLIGRDFSNTTGSCAVDFCAGRRCNNGGLCTLTGCECFDGWEGANCERRTPANAVTAPPCPAQFTCCGETWYFDPLKQLGCCGTEAFKPTEKKCDFRTMKTTSLSSGFTIPQGATFKQPPAQTVPRIKTQIQADGSVYAEIACENAIYLVPYGHIRLYGCCRERIVYKPVQLCVNNLVESRTLPKGAQQDYTSPRGQPLAANEYDPILQNEKLRQIAANVVCETQVYRVAVSEVRTFECCAHRLMFQPMDQCVNGVVTPRNNGNARVNYDTTNVNEPQSERPVLVEKRRITSADDYRIMQCGDVGFNIRNSVFDLYKCCNDERPFYTPMEVCDEGIVRPRWLYEKKQSATTTPVPTTTLLPGLRPAPMRESIVQPAPQPTYVGTTSFVTKKIDDEGKPVPMTQVIMICNEVVHKVKASDRKNLGCCGNNIYFFDIQTCRDGYVNPVSRRRP